MSIFPEKCPKIEIIQINAKIFGVVFQVLIREITYAMGKFNCIIFFIIFIIIKVFALIYAFFALIYAY